MEQPNLTARQREFLLAAFEAEPDPNDYFDFRPVGEAAGFTFSETTDMITKLRGMDYLRVVSNFRMALNPVAREFVREYLYDQQMKAAAAVNGLNKRQNLFLSKALNAAPEDGQTFQFAEIGAKLGWTPLEASDVTQQLVGLGLVRRNSKACYLTPDGREAARQAPIATGTVSERDARLLLALSEAGPPGFQFNVDEVGAAVGMSEVDARDAVGRFEDLGLIGDWETYAHICLSDGGWQAVEQIKVQFAERNRLKAKKEKQNAEAQLLSTPAPEPAYSPSMPPAPATAALTTTATTASTEAVAVEPTPHVRFTRRYLAWTLTELRTKSGDGEQSNEALAALSEKLLRGSEALNAYKFNHGPWWRSKPTDAQLWELVLELVRQGQAKVGGDIGGLWYSLTLEGVIAASKAEKHLSKRRRRVASLWTGLNTPIKLILFLGGLAVAIERIIKYWPPLWQFIKSHQR